MIWEPGFGANITKLLATSSRWLAMHEIASFRTFDVPLAKRTHFGVDHNPFYVGFVFLHFDHPLLNHIARGGNMNFVFAPKTELLTTRTFHVFRTRI